VLQARRMCIASWETRRTLTTSAWCFVKGTLFWLADGECHCCLQYSFPSFCSKLRFLSCSTFLVVKNPAVPVFVSGCIIVLFNDVLSVSRIINVVWGMLTNFELEMTWKEEVVAYFKVLSQRLLGWTEENNVKLQDSQLSSRE